MTFNSILETIGNTPLIRLNKITQGLKPAVYVKCDFLNPGGSVKDRIGLTMLEAAEKAGLIKPGGTIIEGTSGNTGFGLALACVVKGYKMIFTITDKQSREKVNMLKALGAEVVVCPTAVAPEDPRSYYSVAKKLSQEIPNSFYPNQYENPANPKAHYETTGPEIWRDTEGRITHFVAGMGTGGTISGVGKYLKEKNPKIKIIGADPMGSLYWEYFKTGRLGHTETYKVEGIGEDIIPKTIDFSFIDEVLQVTDKDSFLATRRLAREEGIFAGGSSGGALCATLEAAKGLSTKDLIVCFLPDAGNRYVSKIYNDDWMRENRYLASNVLISAKQILEKKRFEKFLFAKPSDKLDKVWKTMERQDISQMPVMENSSIIGSISEDTITGLAVKGQDIKNLVVREFVAEPFPVVSSETSAEDLFKVLTAQTPAVLVKSAAGNLGVLTKYDVVHALYDTLTTP